MSKAYFRAPAGYDGTKLFTRQLQDLLPRVLKGLQAQHQAQPQLVLEAWPKIIGDKLFPMARATRFEEGILYVLVKNSTLLSLLSNPKDKRELLQKIRQTLPAINISNIVFRIG